MQPRSFRAVTFFHMLGCSAFVQMENNEDDIVQACTIITVITGNTTDSMQIKNSVRDAYDAFRTLK